MATLTERMIGAARLDAKTFEEVEHDPNATGQAIIIVVLASVAAGIGAGVFIGSTILIVSTVASLVGWFVWALIVYVIGTKLLPEPATKSNPQEIIRVLGFASTPGLLRIFTAVPAISGLIGLLIAIWIIVAMVIGVRQALDYTNTGRAILVVLLGWIAYMAIYAVIAVPTWLMTRMFSF